LAGRREHFQLLDIIHNLNYRTIFLVYKYEVIQFG